MPRRVEIQDLGPGENVKNVLQILPCNYFWKTKAMRVRLFFFSCLCSVPVLFTCACTSASPDT